VQRRRPDKVGRVRTLWQMLAGFLLGYFLMQWAWDECRNTAVERAIIEGATVRTGAALINLLTPDVRAIARGPRILAAGGGINVRSGCEGTELLFPLFAALAAFRFSWRARLLGIAAGTLLVFVLNQVRLLALFYSWRNNLTLFGELHAFIGPLAMVMFMVVFWVLLLRWDRHWQAGAVR
jgi:exosortase/archaeosortase family protein